MKKESHQAREATPRPEQKDDRSRLMTRRQLSEWLQVHERTIARLVSDPSRGYPVLQVGRQVRFDPDDVKVWMRNQALGLVGVPSEDRTQLLELDQAAMSPEAKMISHEAPRAYIELAGIVDSLIEAATSERDVGLTRGIRQAGRRLVYEVEVSGRQRGLAAFAAIDRVPAHPRKGMRVRVLLNVQHGAAWTAPRGWKKAGSGHWIMASIKREDPMDDIKNRVDESLAYVLRRRSDEDQANAD